MLKTLAPFLVGTLVSLFNKNLVIRVTQSDRQTTIVTPIHKKVSKPDCINYMPASLAFLAYKITQGLVMDSILLHLNWNSLINSAQHRFTRNKSTLTNHPSTKEDS